MVAAEDRPTHDTLRERGRSDPRVFRVLVTVNRGVLAVLFLLFVPAAILLGALFHPVPFEFALTRRAPIQGLYQALVIGTVTGATLVLTLSQLVLSGEFGPVGEQRQRMQEAIDFRHDIEAKISGGHPTPSPAGLMELLLETVLAGADDLEEALVSVDDPELAEQAESYLEHLREDARRAASMLEPYGFGTFSAIEAMFSFDLTAVLHETERLRSRTNPSQDPGLEAVLDEIESALQVFGSARAHVKSLYFERELGDLSRWIIYTSFPAIVVAVASLLFFDPTAIESGWASLTIVSVTISIALTPFAILLAYMLRILKVSQATFSRSPFFVRET